MKRNIELIVKVILLSILIILLLFIKHKSDMAELVSSQKTTVIPKMTYTLKIPEDSSVLVKTDTMELAEEQSTVEAVEKSDPYKTWEEEYFYATKVFKYFTQRGFTKEATAAIIGNMMIETSGGSLSLKPNIYSKSGNYYGLCQWSKKYYPEAHGLSFKAQLDFLFETMPLEFKTFGWLYKDGFDFKDFTKMTNIEEATLAFAKVYERCGPASYNLRQRAARKAYNYFTL